jgi:hypothetical protein
VLALEVQRLMCVIVKKKKKLTIWYNKPAKLQGA